MSAAAIQVVARELAADVTAMLRQRCTARVLCNLPADATERDAVLDAVQSDIDCGSWYGIGRDGRRGMVAVVKALRAGDAVGAAALLADENFARHEDESPEDFGRRYLAEWAREHGVELEPGDLAAAEGT